MENRVDATFLEVADESCAFSKIACDQVKHVVSLLAMRGHYRQPEPVAQCQRSQIQEIVVPDSPPARLNVVPLLQLREQKGGEQITQYITGPNRLRLVPFSRMISAR